MQANNGSIIATVIICSVVLLAFGIYGVNQIPDVPTVIIPTAADIAALIVIPAAPVIDTDKIDKIYDSLDAGTIYVNEPIPEDAIEYARDSDNIDEDDFLELLSDIVGIDEDYLVINSLIIKDEEVTVKNRDALEDGNVKVEGFLKIRYHDEDDNDDTEVVYVVVTADITDLYDEENDQDVEYSIREVDRDFEFD